MRVISLFSGIGAFEEALKNIGVKVDIVNYCEFDRFSAKAYSLIHGVAEDKNLGDITLANENDLPKDIDLITYGFPCQDISGIGKQKGLINLDGTKTRSGLVFDAFRIISVVKPKYAIMENVKNLVGKKFRDDFRGLIKTLEDMGYNNYYKVLNAKNYGIPQNRERIFVISIRKDIDKGFEFPEEIRLTKTVQDLLCNDPAELELLSPGCYNSVFDLQGKLKNSAWESRRDSMKVNSSISPTLTTKNPSGDRAFHGRVYIESIEDVDVVVTDSMREEIKRGKYVIKVLNPREYFRLMGFSDASYNKVKEHFSKNQLYKMAGNSIVVNVLAGIFQNLFQ